MLKSNLNEITIDSSVYLIKNELDTSDITKRNKSALYIISEAVSYELLKIFLRDFNITSMCSPDYKIINHDGKMVLAIEKIPKDPKEASFTPNVNEVEALLAFNYAIGNTDFNNDNFLFNKNFNQFGIIDFDTSFTGNNVSDINEHLESLGSRFSLVKTFKKNNQDFVDNIYKCTEQLNDLNIDFESILDQTVNSLFKDVDETFYDRNKDVFENIFTTTFYNNIECLNRRTK